MGISWLRCSGVTPSARGHAPRSLGSRYGPRVGRTRSPGAYRGGVFLSLGFADWLNGLGKRTRCATRSRRGPSTNLDKPVTLITCGAAVLIKFVVWRLTGFVSGV